MTQDMQADWPVRQLMVHRAENLRVVHGVNEGEPLADAAELLPEDVYELSDDARARPLALAQVQGGAFTVGARTDAGAPGARICLDSLVTFMSADGGTVDALILVELEPGTDLIAAVHVHPFTPMMPKVPYTLVTIDRDGARARLAESATVSFTRGTRITMADGRQVPVEDLAPGHRVLTRDSGPQEVRWTGMQTVRAEGDFAPVRIRAGALHNMGDLVVSPNHRLFIYQRISALGAGQRDLLVRAGLLVNGTSVTRTPGGFVDYVQVLFDHHEIIYAEGIAAESLFADPATRGALPDAIARELDARPPRDAVEGAFELRESDLLARGDAVEVLRRISAN